MQAKNELKPIIIEAIQDNKGSKINVIDLSAIEGASALNFIICEGRSTTQVSAIADNIRETVQKETGRKPYNYDGYRNSQWIVIDYGDTMVHIFLPDIRDFYRLDELWSDAPSELIPDLD